MEIKWCGHASFVITTKDGKKLITDPYEPGAYGGAIGYGPIPDEADVVTISHDHDDHNYTRGLKGAPAEIRGTGSRETEGFKITGFASYHDDAGGSKRGQNTIFAIEADGMRIVHMGDLGHVLSGELVDSLKPVDVLLIPVGGTFTLDAQGATKVVDQLEPRVVIPMHYRTKKCDLPIGPVDDFLKGKERVRKTDSSTISLSKEELPEETEIVVLEPAC